LGKKIHALENGEEGIKEMISREESLKLVNSWVKNKNLIKHMLCVEVVMQSLAKYFSEDKNLWGLAGLIHDADYEKYPEKHPNVLLE
jgi:predicted hydrolase (HD superfamily)